MKKLALLCAGFLLVFVACSSKEPSLLDKRIERHLVLYEFDRALIKGFNSKINANGLLEFELVLFSEDELEFDYKVEWMDDDGFSVKSLGDGQYKKARLKAGEELFIQRVASSKEASAFKIYLNGK